MTAKDRWGHETVKVDGKDVITHYYSENDGWTYKNRGPERSLVVDVHDAECAEAALRASGMKPEIIEALVAQLNKGHATLSYFLDRGDAWDKRST
jgi:hypothetical protein